MKLRTILVAVVLCQLAGLVGAVFTAAAIPTWYAGLAKPPFNPPSWLFAPVWFLLYTLMGLAVALIWEKGRDDKRVRAAVGLFAVQLGLNSLWSGLFFGAHQISWP